MKVFALNGGIESYMKFYPKDEMEMYTGKYAETNDLTKLLWNEPPVLTLKDSKHNQKKYKGKVRKVPDIGHFAPGSVIVNERTVKSIGDYLKRFGKLIKLEVDGETWYSYVVTNILKGVVDIKNSKAYTAGVIHKPIFLADKLPTETQIFKVPENQLVKIYFNDGGNETLQKLLSNNQIDAGELTLAWEDKGGNSPPH
jgi:hypothetical protein